MPRGIKGSGPKKNLGRPIDEQVAEIDAEIAAYKQKISAAKKQRSALLNGKQKEYSEAISKVMKETGLTAEQLLELAKKASSD
ncbi:MAG: hypothetical protein LBJ10_05470 [Clostridiales bacterium]|jgi:hypothetical protein|nr:hypothetical protein [Clostridiales bacterium]